MPIESRNYTSPNQQAMLRANEQAYQAGLDQQQQAQKLAAMKEIADKHDDAKLALLLAGQKRIDTAHSAQAIAKAQDQYNQKLGKLTDQASAISELSDVLKNNNQISLGAARTLLLKMYGMNRYTVEEAKGLVPATIQSAFASIAGSTGSDAKKLSEEQVQDLNQIARETKGVIAQKHALAKQQALSSYASSPYADPGQMNALTAQLGQPFDNYLNELNTKLDTNEKTIQQAAHPGIAQQVPGLLGGIKNLLLGSRPSAPISASNQQPLQAQRPQAQTQVSAQQPQPIAGIPGLTADSIDQELSKRPSGK